MEVHSLVKMLILSSKSVLRTLPVYALLVQNALFIPKVCKHCRVLEAWCSASLISLDSVSNDALLYLQACHQTWFSLPLYPEQR
jgi:hypothetical protein